MAVDWWALAEEEKEQLRRQARRSGEPIAEQEDPDDSWWDDAVPADFSNVENGAVSDQPMLGPVIPSSSSVPQRTDNLETPPLRSFVTATEERNMSERGMAGPSDEVLRQRQSDYVAKVNAGEGGYVEEGLLNKLSAWWDKSVGGAAIAAADALSPFDRLHRATQMGPAGPWAGAAAGIAVGEDESPGQEQALGVLESRFQSAKSKEKAAQVVLDRVAGKYDNELWRQGVETTGDIAGSGSSAFSVFGGPTAALTFGDVFLQEYGKARLAGLDPDQAFDAGVGQSMSEAALSVVPTGSLVRKIPGVSSGIEAIEKRVAGVLDTTLGKAAKVALDTGMGAIGEGAQEGATFMLQDQVRRYQGLVGEEKARQYALEQVVSAEKYTGELWRATRAGAAMGGGIQGASSVVSAIEGGQAITEARMGLEGEIVGRAERVQEAINRANQTFEQDLTAEDTSITPVPMQEQITPEQKAAEEDAAWAQRGTERAREGHQEDRRRSLEREVDEAREDVEVLQEAVEDGARDSQTLNDFVAANRRLEQAEGRLSDYEQSSKASTGQEAMSPVPEPAPEPIVPRDPAEVEAERVETVARLDRIEAIRKTQEDAKKKAQANEKKEQQKAERERKAREKRIREEIVAENPDVPAHELESLYQERLDEPDAARSAPRTTPTPVVPQPRPAAPQQTVKPAPKAVAPGKPVRNAPPVTKNDKDLSDAEVDELRGFFTNMVQVAAEDAANLGMADTAADLRAAGQARRGTTPSEGTTTAPQRIPDIDLEAFKAKTSKLVRALVNRTTRDSRSVQDMIWQGKLNVVPSAAVIGRKSDNAAEYDAGTGAMYLYADKLDNPSDAVGIIARAFHEATHAGQFNDRQGRSNLFRHFLGDPKVQQSAATIRKAAAGGNKIAKEAVRKAEADTASRKGDSRFEDLEVVGYFTSEVVQSRGSALGTVGGVARDITSTAREFLRDKLGMDLDITLGDLNTAAANVGTEIAQTNVRGLNSPQVLGMIYNVTPNNISPAQQEALDNGWVYESVDGTQKFILSDHEATVKPQAVAALRSARGATRLADVIDHPILFSEREGAADLPVYAVSEVLGTARGMYDPGDPAIYVKEGVLNNLEELKGVLLHEAQHYVQDMDGRSGQLYNGRDLVAKQAELQSELADRVRTLDTAARELLDTLPNTLPARERGRLLRDLMRNTTEKDSVNAAVARDFVQGLEIVPQEAADAIAIYEQVRQDYNAYLPKYKAAQAAAHNDYLANITEGEAHFVQDNAGFDTTGVNPEPEMRDRVARQIAVPSQSAPVLGMASEGRTPASISSEIQGLLAAEESRPLTEFEQRRLDSLLDRRRADALNAYNAQQNAEDTPTSNRITLEEGFVVTRDEVEDIFSEWSNSDLKEFLDNPYNIFENTLLEDRFTLPGMDAADPSMRDMQASIAERLASAVYATRPNRTGKVLPFRKQDTVLGMANPVGGNPNLAVSRNIREQWMELLKRDFGKRRMMQPMLIIGRSDPLADAANIEVWIDDLPMEKQLQYRPLLVEYMRAFQANENDTYYERPILGMAANDSVLYSPYLDKLKKLDEDWSYLDDGTDIVEAINNRDENAIRELAGEARSAYDNGEVDFTPNELNALDNLMDWNGDSGTSDMEAIRSRPMFRGNPKGTSGTIYSTDGALGPGVYLTSSRDGAGSYGPAVEQYTMDVRNPLIITMEEVREVEGNTALAIAGNKAFAGENFFTRRAALSWAREQWEDWSGIGDADFPSMLRDAGFDSVVLMDGDTIVEANVLSQRNAIPYDEQAPILGMAAVDAGAADFSPANSPELANWLGRSKIVNKDGTPSTYYHGTKHYINAFQTNDLGLIFASPKEEFAEAFAGLDPATLEHKKPIPLFVRAENPWDYDNADHVNSLLEMPVRLGEGGGTVRDYVVRYYGPHLTPEEAITKLKEGDWSVIETRPVIEAIKMLGHDAIHVYEGRAKNIAVFEPNQLKHATDNKGAWSRQDDSIFGMAAESDSPAKEERARVTNVAVTGAFRNDKGLGENVLNLVELAKSSPAYDTMAAESLVRNYQDSLDAMARERGIPVRDLSREIFDKLEKAASETDSYSDNKAAWANVLSEYGHAGEVLMDMRNRTDALSIEALRLRREQGGDFSPEDLRAHKAIAANLGRYVHRMYAAGSGKAGRKYGQAMWDAHMKKQEGKELSLLERQNAAVVERAMKVLADDLRIPDDASLVEMDRPDLEKLYHTWLNTAAVGLDMDTMIDRLIDARDGLNGDTNELNNHVERAAKDLLNLLKGNVTTPIGVFYRGNKIDRGILKEKKSIAPAIRELMGEIRDPGVALLGSIAKTSEFVARSRLMLDLRKLQGRDLQPPNAGGSDLVAQGNLQPLKGPDYGALEGWYASPNMEAMLKETVEHVASLEQALTSMGSNPEMISKKLLMQIADKWMKGAGYTKAASILGNPVNFGLNFAGSFDTMLQNGNFTSPETQLRALNDAWHLVKYAADPSQSTEAIRLLAKYDVIDSARIGELKNMNYKQLQTYIKSLTKEGGRKRGKIMAVGRGYKETYAMADVWAKIANFHQNVNDLTAYNSAEGLGWTQDEIYSRASAATKRTNFTYSRTAPFIRALERGGITMFGTYFYETYRTQVENIVEVGRDLKMGKDAKTDEGKQIGYTRAAKRLTGIVASNSFKYYAAQALAKAMFGDDEEKWYNIRGLLPDFMDNQDFIPIGRDKNGKWVMFPISRVDAYGPATDILREIMHGNGDPSAVVEQLIDLYIAPRVGGAIIKEIFNEGRKPTTQIVAEDAYGGAVNALARIPGMDGGSAARVVKLFANIGETALPGIVNSWRENNVRPVGTDLSSQMAAYSTYAGVRLYNLDPNTRVQSAGFDYSNFESDTRTQIKDYFKSQVSPSVDVVEDMVLGIAADEKKEWDKLRRIYLGMQDIGMTPDEVRKVMKDSPIPAGVRNSVMSGSFVPTAVSVKSIKSHRDNLLKGKDEEEQAKIKERWDNMVEILEGVLSE